MKIFFTIIVFFIAQLAIAQTKISGVVKDNRGRMLQGISVTVKDSYDGSITDSVGKFSFKTFEKGAITIVAKSIEYKMVEQKVEANGSTLNISFSLKEEISELKAVTVTAGSFEAGDKKKAATVLSSLDVYTTGGANADITSAIKTLPGAQQVGEQEGLFVRGGAGYETKQFIDGTVVGNPFNASVPDIASRGRFAPNLFKGTVFSTGGYSALYGQALSSAVILESIDLPERSEVSASLSAIFYGVGSQILSKNKKSSYGFNYGYTNLTPYFKLIKQAPDFFKAPELHNGDINFRIKTKKGGFVKFYSSFGTNDIGLRRPDIDDIALKNAFSIKNFNWYNNLSWKENLGKGWKMNIGTSFSTNTDKLFQQNQNQNNQPTITGISYIDDKNFNLQTQFNFSQIKAVFDKRLSGISVVRFGGEYWNSYNKTTFVNSNQSFSLNDNFSAVFSEADIYLTNNIAAKIGARAEYSSIINKANLAPRVSFAYKFNNGGQMSLIYGDFYQRPENNYLFFPQNNLGYLKATHYMVNYIKNTKERTFRVEAFLKQYDNLIETPPAPNFNFTQFGSGYAKGIEIFWRDKKTIKGLDYWITYSFLDTKRQFDRYPTMLQPTFAANHTASLVVKRFFPKINTGFNFTYSFATGRPYYNFQNVGGKFEIADQGKTINFNNLGFSANYLTKIAKAYTVIVVSMTNVLNQNQIFGYNYNNSGTRKVEVTPPAPRFFFIGFFLSWGVDRRQDAINNNL
jgi:vitamin B12 transporter